MLTRDDLGDSTIDDLRGDQLSSLDDLEQRSIIVDLGVDRSQALTTLVMY